MPLDLQAARDLIAFYLEAGVDAVLTDEPVDRFAEPQTLAPPARERTPPGARQAGAARPALRAEAQPSAPLLPPPNAAASEAREAARTAKTLDELRSILVGFEGCGLKATATQLVFADGNPRARLMLVGEAPGKEEDFAGLPFVGRSGKLLDRMLAAIGLDRTSVYIANVLPWWPPGNRTPSSHETQICLPFIRRHIELCDPDILVCLGGSSAETLLGQKGITKIRGRWFDYDTGTRTIRAMPTFHPAFLLRSPLQKRFAWRDLLAVRNALEQTRGAAELSPSG